MSWPERFRAFTGIWHMVLLLVLILGGIYSGIMTVNEAAAVGAVGALAISTFTGRLSLRLFRDSNQGGGQGGGHGLHGDHRGPFCSATS